MKKHYLLNGLATLIAMVTFSAQSIFAQQQYVHQIIILNEGRYSYDSLRQEVPVTLASYNLATKEYKVFATITNAKFGSDILIDDNNIYVAADDELLVYDKNTYQLINSTTVEGIRKLALWNDQLLVTRGDVAKFNAYIQAYKKSDLSLVYELDTTNGPSYSTEGIVVLNDTAYVAINNSYQWGNYKGLIGIVDLKKQQYMTEVDMGPDATNPDNIMIDGNDIYTLNNTDWTGSSITAYDASKRTTKTTKISVSSGCGTSVKALDYIYYLEYSMYKVARYDVKAESIADTLANSLPYYGMVTDEINNVIYATTTDYVSSGKAYILDYNGAFIDSFDVGVSPGSLALDIRTTTDISQLNRINTMSIYPNPTSSQLVVEFKNNSVITSIKLLDLVGKEIYRENINKAIQTKTIDMSMLSNGIYFLEIKTEEGVEIMEKIMKQ